MAAIYTLKDLTKDIIDICMDKWVPSELLEGCNDVKRTHAALPEATRGQVDINEYQRVLMAWRYNSFGHHTESDGLVMYNRISMMSHSCRSTCCWHYGENDTLKKKLANKKLTKPPKSCRKSLIIIYFY